MINSPLNSHLVPLFTFTFKPQPADDCPRSHSSISSCARCLITFSFSVFHRLACCCFLMGGWTADPGRRGEVLEWEQLCGTQWLLGGCGMELEGGEGDVVETVGNSLSSESVSVSVSPFLWCSSEQFIVWYSGWGMRPVGSLEKCQKGFSLFVSGSNWCIHVMWQTAGSWCTTGSRTERNGVCFFFLVASFVFTPSVVYTFIEAATEAKHREERTAMHSWLC